MASIAGQRSVLTPERELRAVVVESISREALHGVTALAVRRNRLSRVSVRKTDALAAIARVVRVLVARGTANGKRAEPHRLTRPRGKEPALAPMAQGAIYFCVPALKRKPRVSLVLEQKGVPLEAVRRMTGLAVPLELAEVDVLVAGITARRQRPETHRLAASVRKPAFRNRVALRAGYRAVFSGQREARLLVIERSLPETLDHVAARTVLVWELAQMGISIMAIAAAGEGEVLEALIPVTAGAVHFSVHAAQRKRGAVVIEAGREGRPGARLVTTLTVGAQARPVRVLVAILAGGKASDLEARTRVTAPAADLLVRATERERRLVVIESNVPEIPIHGMTLEAGLAQLSAVGILVTGAAARVVEEIRLRLHPRGSASRVMALHAFFDREVQAQEGISGLSMVEPFRVEANELHFVSVMLGVAADAIARLLAMESGAFSDPFLQVPVTGQAFLRFDAFSRGVAGSAVLEAGELGVRPTQRPRRDQRIESLSRGAGREERREETRHGPTPLHQESP